MLEEMISKLRSQGGVCTVVIRMSPAFTRLDKDMWYGYIYKEHPKYASEYLYETEKHEFILDVLAELELRLSKDDKKKIIP